jgi:nicotinate-nucleotide pyrophosphorylase (carboxylating)
MYQRGRELDTIYPAYKKRAMDYMNSLLEKDLGKGDLTSLAVISPDSKVTAYLRSKEEGIVAGLAEVVEFITTHGIREHNYCLGDGEKAHEGESLLFFKGDARTILGLERTALNVARRMSGIATLTRQYADLLGTGCHVAATRKTVMDEHMEKHAVYIGRGLTHRLGLDDFVMVKDRHLDCIQKEGYADPVTEAVRRCYAASLKCPIEIETRNYEEAVAAATAFAKYMPKEDIGSIMLDNMLFADMTRTVEKIRTMPIYSRIILEASGGITLATAERYARTGVDVLSTSEITEKARQLDLHLKLQ